MEPTTLCQTRTIQPIAAPFQVTLQPPGSKSLTNRALLLAALAAGRSTLRHPLSADDTHQMLTALEVLGFEPVLDPQADHIQLTGCGGRLPGNPAEDMLLNLGNAGTAYRFLTAACCLGRGRYTLDGVMRMRQRPIGQLVEALRRLGGRIDYLQNEGYPPLLVHGTGGLVGGELVMPTTLSSQYLSALLQVGPYCDKGLTLRFDGPVTSQPYVTMTLALMQRFGVTAQVEPPFKSIRIEPGGYRHADELIEPDASNASYFLAAAAIVPGSRCTIQGLGRQSLQGDVGFADLLHAMGAGLVFGPDFVTVMSPPPGTLLKGITVDLNPMPDMAQTLASVAVFAQGPTTIQNVGNLRIKETDRLTALATELGKLGVQVRIDGDNLTITPPPDHRIQPAVLDTYEDHRMAMALTVIGLRATGVTIRNPRCVDKTFPRFFEYLARLDPTSP